MFQVIVAFPRQSDRERVGEALELSGEFSCLAYKSAAQVKRAVAKRQLGAVICGFKLADETAEDLYQDLPDWCSMLMIAPQDQLDLCGAEGILKLAAPVRRGELLAAARVLVRLCQQAPETGRPAEGQRLIEGAKAALMAREGMDEAQAHRFLQKQSMDRGMPLEEVARQVLGDSV